MEKNPKKADIKDKKQDAFDYWKLDEKAQRNESTRHLKLAQPQKQKLDNSGYHLGTIISYLCKHQLKLQVYGANYGSHFCHNDVY